MILKVILLGIGVIVSFSVGVSAKAAVKKECGTMNAGFKRIVGGSDVQYMKFPWYVVFIERQADSQQRSATTNDKRMTTEHTINCGGSLITDHHVLTAAHCYHDHPKPAKKFWAILNMLDQCKAGAKDNKIAVTSVKLHEKYADHDPFFDVAIVRLAEKVTNIPVCLPTNPLPRWGIISGFGALKFDHAMTNIQPCQMQELIIDIHNDTECIKMLQDNEVPMKPEDKQTVMCAGNLEGGEDSCSGDSGGPLHTLDAEGRYYIDGLISFGFGCAAPGTMGVYTKVRPFLSWIKCQTMY